MKKLSRAVEGLGSSGVQRAERGLRCALLLSLLPGLLGAADIPYADDAWIEVETPHFRLLGNAERSVILGIAERLEHFRAAATILTGATRIDSSLPTRVFVFGGESWTHFQGDSEIAGYFIPDMEANFIGLDTSGAEDDRAMETVLHEYVHFLSRNQGSRVHHPTWYEEGFADAISTAKISDGQIHVGSVLAGRAADLEQGDWLPLDRVVTARGYAQLDSDERTMFHAQSWLLVHRLTWGHVAGLEPRYERVEEYITRVAAGADEASVFREAFGLSFEAMQQQLRDYLGKGPPEIRVDQEAPEVAFEPVVGMSADRAHLVWLGELQLARGEEGAPQAEALARRVLKTAPRNARALLLLAGALIQQGQEPGDELAARALAFAPDDAEIVRGAARLGVWRLQRVEIPVPDRRKVAIEARALFERALALTPDAPAAHAGLGYTQLWLNDPVAADRSLQQAFRLARWNLQLALALGELHATYGRPEDARRLLLEVVASAHDEAMSERAQQLLEGLDTAARDR